MSKGLFHSRHLKKRVIKYPSALAASLQTERNFHGNGMMIRVCKGESIIESADANGVIVGVNTVNPRSKITRKVSESRIGSFHEVIAHIDETKTTNETIQFV